MSAQLLMLTTDALVAEVATTTRRAVDAWRARWGLDALAFDIDVTPWEGNCRPTSDVAGAWLESTGESPTTVFWPAELAGLIASTLYPRETGEANWTSSSLAAASAHHVDVELQRMLADAWSAAGPFGLATPDWRLSRWQAPVRIEIRLGETLSIVSLAAGVSMRRSAAEPQRQLQRLGPLDVSAFDALTAHAELIVGTASLPVPDLAALQVGDVIVLDAFITDPLELRVQHGAATLRAAIGLAGPHRAAKIVSQPHS